jgi:hypothetical protein
MNKEQKQNWIESEIKKIHLVNPEIIPMSPLVGFFFKVNNLEIPETIFKEEYDLISKAYSSVLHKLKSQEKEV